MASRYRRNTWARIAEWQYAIRVYWVYHGKCIASAFLSGFIFACLCVVLVTEFVIGLTW